MRATSYLLVESVTLETVRVPGLKYILVLVEFKHTEFFTSYGGYLLNTKL